MIPVLKRSVEGSLTVKSTLHADIEDIVIRCFKAVNRIVHSGIIQILAEVPVECSRECSR